MSGALRYPSFGGESRSRVERERESTFHYWKAALLQLGS